MLYKDARQLLELLRGFLKKPDSRLREMFSAGLVPFGEWAEARRLADVLRERDGGMDAAGAEYSALFEGTDCDIHIPLWESACAEEGDRLLDRTTLSVIREYLDFRLFPCRPAIPPDALELETEFLLYLLDTGAAEAPVFFREHVLPFARRVLECVRGCAAGDFYRRAPEFLLAGLRSLGEGFPLPAPGREAGSAVPPPGFRRVTEEEKRILWAERQVRTAGRNNCGGRCAVTAFLQAGCVTRVGGVPGGEIAPCVKGRNYHRTFLNARRLRYPMLRTGMRGEGKFRRITWEEAEDLICRKLREIRDRYGPGARYVNYGSGVSAVLRGDRLARRLLALDGGYLGLYNTYSAACADMMTPYIYGTQEASPSWDTYDDSKLVVLWGSNPVVTNYSASVLRALRGMKERNIPVIVIDPRFTETAAAFATEWIPILPGTDGALAAAIAYVLIRERLLDTDFLARYCIGFDRMPDGYGGAESYTDYILGTRDGTPKTPAWAAPVTGVGEETILSLARRLGTIKPAAIIPGLGPQRHSNGEQQVRSVAALACLTGNIGISGGSPGVRGKIRKHRSPRIPDAENPCHTEIPSFLWTKAVAQGKTMTREADGVRGRERLESGIKLILNLAGNTLVNQHGDINTTAAILRDTGLCEFIVVSDLFMTPSARFADLLLPATSMFEESFIPMPRQESTALLYGNQVIEPLFESRSDTDWLMSVAKKLGLENFSEGCETDVQWLEQLYHELRDWEPELPDFSEFARNGGHIYRENEAFVPFREQIAEPARYPFHTESGKIELFSASILKHWVRPGIDPIPKYEPVSASPYPLRVVGAHSRRRCHSIHDPNPWLERAEPHRVWINTEDARERDIAEGAPVTVFNEFGRIRIRAHVTGRIMKGVACIFQGAWYLPDSDGTDTRGSINTLASLVPTPFAKGNTQHSVRAEIRACAGE